MKKSSDNISPHFYTQQKKYILSPFSASVNKNVSSVAQCASFAFLCKKRRCQC